MGLLRTRSRMPAADGEAPFPACLSVKRICSSQPWPIVWLSGRDVRSKQGQILFCLTDYRHSGLGELEHREFHSFQHRILRESPLAESWTWQPASSGLRWALSSSIIIGGWPCCFSISDTLSPPSLTPMARLASLGDECEGTLFSGCSALLAVPRFPGAWESGILHTYGVHTYLPPGAEPSGACVHCWQYD